MKTSPFRCFAGALGFAAMAAACSAPEPQEEPEPPGMFEDGRGVLPGSVRPWTDAFLKEAVLVANRITIEGPSDLLQHVAIRTDERLDILTQTTKEGLRQDVTRKGGAGWVEIHVQVDAWAMVAMQELKVLQRPGEVPVRIVAEGNAAWIPADGSGEVRQPRIEFVGHRPSMP